MLVKNIIIYPKGEGQIEKSVWRITLWHHEFCRVMTNGESEGQIFLSTSDTYHGFIFILTSWFPILFKNKTSVSSNTTNIHLNDSLGKI